MILRDGVLSFVCLFFDCYFGYLKMFGWELLVFFIIFFRCLCINLYIYNYIYKYTLGRDNVCLGIVIIIIIRDV